MKTKGADCERKIASMHRVPKYFGFYKGRDGWHTPYNGNFAHIYISAGAGAFREKDFDTEPAYVDG